MSDKDSITKEYMEDATIFADAFNFLLYDGEQVIKPEQLRPLDTTAVVLPYGGDDAPVPLQRFRDVMKMVTLMEDENAAYLLLGIENQSQIHYAMPVRNMLYDAMQYVAQVEGAAKSHRGGGAKPESGAEFLSGFYRSDKLLPVITLTLYFGADEWSAPTDLHGMLAANGRILRFVDNYHLHLIAPAQISPEDFAKFHSELGLALHYIRASRSMEQLSSLVNEVEQYRCVSKRTADLVNVVTGSELHYDKGKENVNMCLAIEQMRNESIRIGLEKGRLEGMEKGRLEGMEKGRLEGLEKGMEKGMEKGRESGVFGTLSSLVRKGLLSVAAAAEEAHVSVEEFERRTGLNAE